MITREKFLTFLKDGSDFQIMGLGIEDLEIQFNANTESKHYIHEKVARSNTSGYAPSFDVEQEAFSGDPLFEYLDGIIRTLGVGSEAKSEVILAYLYDGTVGAFEADKYDCNITLNSKGGSGGGALRIGYTISLDGEPKAGKVAIADGKATFTANV